MRGMAALAREVMALWQYLGFLTLSAAELQSWLKKRYGFEVTFPHATRGARWGEKVGPDLGRHAVAGFISWGEQISLRPARGHWWRTRRGSEGRQASLCKHVVLVVVKQLVIHLQIRCQKTDIGFMMVGGELHAADPYKRIGATSDHARERLRWGGRPTPGGERRRIVASAALERLYLQEKCDLGSKPGVKVKPSHFRRDCW